MDNTLGIDLTVGSPQVQKYLDCFAKNFVVKILQKGKDLYRTDTLSTQQLMYLLLT
jgi:hypothetical protein